MARAIWNGAVIAGSDAVVEFEGNLRFPPDSGNFALLLESETRSACHWNGGDAHCFHLEVDGKTLRTPPGPIAW